MASVCLGISLFLMFLSIILAATNTLNSIATLLAAILFALYSLIISYDKNHKA